MAFATVRLMMPNPPCIVGRAWRRTAAIPGLDGPVLEKGFILLLLVLSKKTRGTEVRYLDGPALVVINVRREAEAKQLLPAHEL
ncbi:hypothetical protein ColTof4_01129 [Colletotrichum tofieldiae]|nr:hypothetical protein ColTof3_08354 [Colletotrichum tofieldiae]GKT68706.1 hypothetical protein ColTof4_01129 [Colletotrichum tofieldiae]GKT96722.1 hypothetical protein Ct61P_14572 [Colletotrichum tofieldiae]